MDLHVCPRGGEVERQTQTVGGERESGLFVFVYSEDKPAKGAGLTSESTSRQKSPRSGGVWDVIFSSMTPHFNHFVKVVEIKP